MLNKAKMLVSKHTPEELATIANATEIELDETKAALSNALSVLRYYRDECSGNEPSISVFNRDLDRALSHTPSECLNESKTDALNFFVEQVEDAQECGFISNKEFTKDLKACVKSHIEIHYGGQDAN